MPEAPTMLWECPGLQPSSFTFVQRHLREASPTAMAGQPDCFNIQLQGTRWDQAARPALPTALSPVHATSFSSDVAIIGQGSSSEAEQSLPRRLRFVTTPQSRCDYRVP